MLMRDPSAIMAGEAGSRFAKGDKAKLKDRIAALEIVLAKLNDADAQKT